MKVNKKVRRVRVSQSSMQHANHFNKARQSPILRLETTVKKLDFDEKIELFQQLEIAQGIRKSEKSFDELSELSRKILRIYDELQSPNEKDDFADKVKKSVFVSLKKAIAEG